MRRAKSAITLAFALGGAFLLASCESADERKSRLLTGTWRCSALIAASATMPAATLVGTTQYIDGGTVTSQIVMELSEQGQSMRIEAIAGGSWRIANGALIETVERVSIMAVSVNGVIIPLDSIPQADLDAMTEMAGFAESSEIRVLSETDLKLYYAATDAELNCTSA